MSIRNHIIAALTALILPSAAFARTAAPQVSYQGKLETTAYFWIEPGDDGEELESLTLDIYDNVRSFVKVATYDLLASELADYLVAERGEHMYGLPVPVNSTEDIVYQVKYKHAGQPEITGQLHDGDKPFVYMTDLPRGSIKVGWHIPFYDIAYDGKVALRTTESEYAKGYGVHAPGWVETPATLDLSQFERFKVDVGGQIITNPTRGRLGFQLYNGGDQPFENTGNVAWDNVYSWDFELRHTEPGTTLKIQFTDGGDANTNDIVCIGAPRFYYKSDPEAKKSQTIEFDSPGRTIFEDDPQVVLGAYASGGTPVFFNLVTGSDIATLEGNVLTPKDGYSGEVEVQAMTLGNGEYRGASATQTYSFRFGPVVEYVSTHRDSDDGTQQTMYLYVNTKGKTLEKLNLEVYDNVRSFEEIITLDLTSALEQYKAEGLSSMYAIPLEVPGGGVPVHRLTYKFAGEPEVAGHLQEGKDAFDYMNDLPGCNSLSNANYQVGWGSQFYNTSYDNKGPLKTSTHTYKKGYGAHAAGYVQTPSNLDLSQYTRFCVDVGGQVIDNPTRGKVGFLLYNGLSTAYLNTGNVPWNNVYEWDFTLQATGAGKTVKIQFTNGDDGNTNDIICIGAPRFYYATESKLAQTIDWAEEQLVNDYLAFTQELDATASSNLPVLFRLVSGSEYARLEGKNLTFFNIPSEGRVVVEAYQPGNKDYDAAESRMCTFRIRKALVIAKDQVRKLQGGNDIDELVIMADNNSAGQAVVESGIVNVKKLVLKYTFVPGEWNHISFPSDLDLNKVSDLQAKGYACASEEGQAGTYVLREYNETVRGSQTDVSPWTSVATGMVKGLKGYIMKLENGVDGSAEPVEITFNIDNVALDFDSRTRSLNLEVDLSKCEPETRHTVYVRPTNVKGNTLRVDMRYVPPTKEELPINHAKALETMRVTRADNGASIRLTLPDSSPAKVVIYDRKGRKMLKAVNYVAPMKIDLSDLKHGKYRMVVLYGPAGTERELEL